jgi:hypothetical protein
MTAVDFLLSKTAKHCFNQQEIEEAKEMENEQKLTQELFLGKVVEIIGFSETIELLKESKETFNLSPQDKP